MMQVSSAAVSTFVNVQSADSIARSSDPSRMVLKCRSVSVRVDCASARSSSPARVMSQSACVTSAFSITVFSSTARSIGIVATAMPPALITPNQDATIIGLFGARSSTRLPGTSPMSCTSTFATRFAWRCNSAYVHVTPVARRQVRSPRPSVMCRSSSAVAQFNCAGKCSDGSVQMNSGCSCTGGRLSRANVSTCALGIYRCSACMRSRSRAMINCCTSLAPS